MLCLDAEIRFSTRADRRLLECEGGQLTERVRRRPYSVVLLDEVEKAHPDVFNILLQVLDDGRLTDGQGRTVDFKNTVVIMTSNVGSSAIIDETKSADEKKAEVREALKAHFRPEFLNRLDEVVDFNPLDQENLKGIVDVHLEDLRVRLEKKQIKLELSDEVKAYLAKIGFDPVYGARPLKRVIQKNIQNEVAKMIISRQIQEHSTLKIEMKDTALNFEVV